MKQAAQSYWCDRADIVTLQLYEEIVSVCNTEEITIDQLNQLKYLECCLNEGMRLYPQGFRYKRLTVLHPVLHCSSR